MKKTLLLIALLGASFTTLNAQEAYEINSKEIKYHDNIELGVGFGTLVQIIGGLNSTLNDNDDYPSEGGCSVSDDYRSLPALNLNYSRQLTPLVSLGVTVGYSQLYSTINQNREKVGYYLCGSLAVIPTVRFDWLRMDYIRLYSRAGLGLGNYMDREIYYDSSRRDIKNDTIGPHIDIVPFGMTFGRKLYGFLEVSLGTIGFYKAGLGYRF